MSFDPGVFKCLDANPGGTLELFNKYTERMSLVFEPAFDKDDGTPYKPSDKLKKVRKSCQDPVIFGILHREREVGSYIGSC